ncbi:MAG: hypothetical protein ACI9SG_000127 [Maribacter sp.]|jgi:hypothetical protein
MMFIKTYLDIQVAKKLFLWIFLIDLIFVAIHFVTGLLYYLGFIEDIGEYGFLVLTQDESYAEMFQYIKYVALIVMTVYLIILEKSYSYASWTLLYLFFLLDDSLSLHEKAGEFLVQKHNFKPMLGLRAVDLGELTFMAAMGVVVLSVLSITYFTGSIIFKKRTITCLILLGFLMVFGIGFDMVHVIFGENLIVNFVIGLIEDGGEMIIVTLMVCYTYQLIYPVDTYSTPYLK